MGACCSSVSKTDVKGAAAHREALALLPLTDHDLALLHRFFRKMDKDKDGKVKTFDFLMAIDVERSKFVMRTFSIMDSLHTGELSFREFVVAIWNYCTFEDSSIYLFAFDLYDVGNTGIVERSDLEIMLKEVYGDSPQLHHELDRLKSSASRFHDGITPETFGEYVRQHPNMLFPVFTMQRTLREKVIGDWFWKEATRKRQAQKVHWREAVMNIKRRPSLEEGPTVVYETSRVSSPRQSRSKKAGLLPPSKYSSKRLGSNGTPTGSRPTRISSSRKIKPEDTFDNLESSSFVSPTIPPPRRARISASSARSRSRPSSAKHSRGPSHLSVQSSGAVEVAPMDTPASWMETPMIDSPGASFRVRASRTSHTSAAEAAAALASTGGIAMPPSARTSNASGGSAGEAALVMGTLADRKLAAELMGTGGSTRSDASFRSEGSRRSRVSGAGLGAPGRPPRTSNASAGSPADTGPLMWTPSELNPTRPVSMSGLEAAHGGRKGPEPRGRSRSPAGERRARGPDMAAHSRSPMSSPRRSKSPTHRRSDSRSKSPTHRRTPSNSSLMGSRPGSSSGRRSRPSSGHHRRSGSGRSVGSHATAGSTRSMRSAASARELNRRVEARLPY